MTTTDQQPIDGLSDELSEDIQMALGFMQETLEAVENGVPLTTEQVALIRDAMLYADVSEQISQ